MKNTIRNILKNSKLIYLVYYYVFSFLLRFLGLFVKTRDDLVLFVEYSGRKFDDSPRVLYDYMVASKRYSRYKTVWAFEHPEKYELPNSNKIKIDTLKYYITALRAKYWITNSSITRGLNFKKKSTKYVIFQHGTAGIKVLGNDVGKDNKSFKIKNGDHPDIFIIQGKKERELIESAFDYDNEIKEIGLPRNDELYHITPERVKECREKLGIPEGKKVIIYTPTFREFYKDNKLDSYIELPFEIEKMKKAFSKEYVLVVTAHYEVAKMLKIPKNDDFVINAFGYPRINDILIAGDIMISDYSSVIFDYSILERPIFCFGYDYDDYMKERGTYLDLNNLFCDGIIKSQDELIEKIKKMNYEKECRHTRKIKNEYILGIDNSTERAAEEIFKDSVMQKKRVLHVISTLKRGGTEKYMFNLINETKEEYDNYVLYYYGDNELGEEPINSGAKIIRLGKDKCGNIKTMRTIRKVIKENDIDIVYSYTFYNSAYVSLAAFFAGCKKRIVHSHRACYDDEKVNPLKLLFAKIVVSLFSTDRLACNRDAGKGLFVNRFKIIENGIDLRKYQFDAEVRGKIRKGLGIKDSTIVLGTVGTLNNNKNQKYLIDVIYELNKKMNVDARAIIVGGGEKLSELKKYAEDRSVGEEVYFVGTTEEAHGYYNAFDVFVLTSKKEGFPYVLIEAQANGAPVLSSLATTPDTKINDNFTFMDLDDGPEKWARWALEMASRGRTCPASRILQYSNEETSRKIVEIYEKKRKISIPKIAFVLLLVMLPVIGLIVAAALYFKRNSNKENIAYSLLFGMLIGLFAYHFVPDSNFDLARHHKKVEIYSQVNTVEEFSNAYNGIELEAIPQVYSFVISRLNNKNLLQFFVVVVGYGAILYMIADYKNKIRLDNKYFVPVFITVLFAQPAIYYFSGLYNYLAINIFALAFYLDYNSGRKVTSMLIYATLPLLHTSMLLPVGVVVLFKILRNKINVWSILIILLIASFFTLNLGHYLVYDLGMNWLMPVQKVLDNYTALNEHYIIQNYGGLGFVINIAEILMAALGCLFTLKDKKNSETKAFLAMFIAIVLLIIPRIVVMVRFAPLVLIISSVIVMDILKTKKNIKKYAACFAICVSAVVLCAYSAHAIIPHISGDIRGELLASPVNLFIK